MCVCARASLSVGACLFIFVFLVCFLACKICLPDRQSCWFTLMFIVCVSQCCSSQMDSGCSSTFPVVAAVFGLHGWWCQSTCHCYYGGCNVLSGPHGQESSFAVEEAINRLSWSLSHSCFCFFQGVSDIVALSRG